MDVFALILHNDLMYKPLCFPRVLARKLAGPSTLGHSTPVSTLLESPFGMIWTITSLHPNVDMAAAYLGFDHNSLSHMSDDMGTYNGLAFFSEEWKGRATPLLPSYSTSYSLVFTTNEPSYSFNSSRVVLLTELRISWYNISCHMLWNYQFLGEMTINVFWGNNWDSLPALGANEVIFLCTQNLKITVYHVNLRWIVINKNRLLTFAMPVHWNWPYCVTGYDLVPGQTWYRS